MGWAPKANSVRGVAGSADFARARPTRYTVISIRRAIMTGFGVWLTWAIRSASRRQERLEGDTGELVRQVDSSLLDEWEQLTNPDDPLDAPVAVPARPRPLTGNERAFTAMVRNALFRRVELFARQRAYDLGQLDTDSGWTAERWQDVIDAYFDEHDDVGIGADARGPALLIIDRQPGVWRVRQILDDPAGDHDWGFDVEVDLEASDEEGAAVVRVVDAGRSD